MKTPTQSHQISEDGSAEWLSPVLCPENEIEATLVRSFILGEMPKTVTAFGPWVGDTNPTTKTLKIYCPSGEKIDAEGWLKIHYGPLPIRARAFGNEYGLRNVKVEWELVADFEKNGIRAFKQGNNAPYPPVVSVTDEAAFEAYSDPLNVWGMP